MADEGKIIYDDFFSDPDDQGVDAVFVFKGKTLHFKLKRSLTLAEKQRASDASVKISISDQGIPTLEKMNQGAYTTEIVLAAVKSWPFEYANGSPVPINRQTVSRMDGSLAEKIAARVLGQEANQKDALVPFATKLGEVSSQEEQPTQS